MADQTDDRGLPMMRPEGSKEPAPQRHGELPRPTTEQANSLASPSISALLHTPANPAHAPVSQSAADLPRPGSEAAHVAALSSKSDPKAPSDSEVDARTLIVGQGVIFSGDLSACDHLIVEGRVEANLHDCQNMMITDTGIFRGSGSTENADVSGRIDGEFLARNRLLIRAGGHVSGTITYGEIEIESGGKISGTIQLP